MATIPAAQPWSRLAVVALVLGLLSLVFWYVGPVALVVGYFAVRGINESDGRQRGARLAWAGLGGGLVGCVLLVLWLFGVVVASLYPTQLRTADMNHLRQIGLAVTRHLDGHGRYPPAVAQGLDLPPEERLSWLVLILPELERQRDRTGRYARLAASVQLDKGYEAPANAEVRQPLSVYQSPAAPPEVDPVCTSYVGVTGVGADAATLPAAAPDAGFFGYARLIAPDDLRPGITYTLVAAETTRGGPWGRGGPGTAVGVPATGDDLVGANRPFGGLHTEGFHLLFADASVSFRRADLNPHLLRTLARINRTD